MGDIEIMSSISNFEPNTLTLKYSVLFNQLNGSSLDFRVLSGARNMELARQTLIGLY